METWLDDLSGRSMDEVMRSLTENRAWSKELRTTTRDLVTSRLAKEIDLDQYAATRILTNQDVAECKRREVILMNEVRIREGRSSQFHPDVIFAAGPQSSDQGEK